MTTDMNLIFNSYLLCLNVHTVKVFCCIYLHSVHPIDIKVMGVKMIFKVQKQMKWDEIGSS